MISKNILNNKYQTMNLKLVFVTVLLVLSVSAYDEEDHVLVLHDNDFPAVLEDFPAILIEFYAPW